MSGQATKKWIIKSLGLILFLFILWRIDEKQMMAILLQSKSKYLVLGLLLTIPLTLIKSMRWRRILKALNYEYPIALSCSAYFAGQFWGLVSPARVGEFIKVRYLQARNVSVVDATFSVLIDRISDVISLFFIGALSLLFWVDKFEIFPYLVIIILSALFVITALVALSLRKAFLNQLLKVVPEKLRIKILEFLQGFRQNIVYIRPNDYGSFFLYTHAGWVIYFTLAYSLALALSIDLPFLTLMSYVAITASVVVLIPVSISGIGTRDATLIFLFSTQGISMELAVSFSVLMFATQAFLAFIGFTAWAIKPPQVNQSK